MKVLLTHPGLQHAPHLAAALHGQGILHRFATGLAFPDTPTAWWWKIATSAGAEKLLRKRLIPGLPAGMLHLQPFRELWALFRHQVLGQGNDAVFYPRNKAFQQQLPERLIREADVVIGFDTSSWILAEKCRSLGKPFILDASIAHPLAKEKVYESLRQQYPEWSKELAPKQPHLIEAELQEMELAHHIVVASAFTKKTYTDHGIPAEKITVNAYGTNVKKSNAQNPNFKEGAGSALEFGISTCGISEAGISPLTFLFFGSLTARKGFPWLCEVWPAFHRKFPHAKLLAAGYNHIPPGFTVPAGIEVVGAVHPADRATLFARANVFVFPSYFEGFAQVILEAMACGLPIISTNATAAPDLLGDSGAGFVHTPGDGEALLAALAFFAENPAKIPDMGNAARFAAAPYTWQAYGQRWENIIRKVAGM